MDPPGYERGGQRAGELNIEEWLSPGEAPEEILDHVDRVTAVGRIQEDAEAARWGEQVGERVKACVRVGEVVEHTRGDDVVEASLQRAGVLDRQALQLEVAAHSKLVCARTSRSERSLAQVDADHLHLGVVVRDRGGRMAGATAGVEHPQPAQVRSSGPEHVLRVVHQAKRRHEPGPECRGRWVRVLLVLIANPLPNRGRGRPSRARASRGVRGRPRRVGSAHR